MTIIDLTTRVQELRQQFPGLADKFYFNFGGQGTMPRKALEAIIDAYEYTQQAGPFSLEVNSWLAGGMASTREAIATELGAPPETITLTENVTAGCNIALWGIDWQPGDRILITDCEHPGIIAIVTEIARRFKVEVSSCPIMATLDRGDPAAIIEQHLQPNTRLVVLSHLLWNTGQVLPLDRIVGVCHAYSQSNKPVLVLVDAAQSVGSLPLNLTRLQADFYAFTGHKWWCGPAGVGGLYVRPEASSRLYPTFIGWRGIDTDSNGQPTNWKKDGQRFEVATSAYPQYQGLKEAIALHQRWGTAEERYWQICQLSKYLWEGLANIEGIDCLKTSPPDAGLVSFRLKNPLSTKQLVQSLESRGFFLRSIAHPNCARACVHYFTLKSEIERLVEEIEKLVA